MARVTAARLYDLFKLLVLAGLIAAVVLVTPRVPVDQLTAPPTATPTPTLSAEAPPIVPVTLDAITPAVDQTAAIVLTGGGPPDARLRLQLAEQPLGEAIVDADGRWTLTTDALHAGQVYVLAVDQLAADGTPLAASRQFLTIDRSAEIAPAPTEAPALDATPTLTTTPAAEIVPTLPVVAVDDDTPFSCRFGVDNTLRDDDWPDLLHAGWSLDFQAGGQSTARSRYVRLIYLGQEGDRYLVTSPARIETLEALVAANPGDLWMIGNEPDTDAQDGLLPTLYADAYHDLYTLIKGIDPTALIANAGLVSRTPNRIEYLDIAYETYRAKYGVPMPVDVWNAHLYMLPEMDKDGLPHPQWQPSLGTDGSNGIRESDFDPASCSDPNDNRYCYAEHDNVTILANQLRAMRAWMQSKGEQNKPLIVSEWSILFPYELDADGCFVKDEFGNCFTPERVSTYLRDSVALFQTARDPLLGYALDDNRLIQGWAWFSTQSRGVGSASNLVMYDPPALSTDALTPIGQTFLELAAADPRQANLVVGSPRLTPNENGGTTLSAVIANNGTIPAASFLVTFYADAALFSPIGSVPVNRTIEGCGWRQQTVTLDVADPIERFWVQVDSSGSVPESNERDNIAQGQIEPSP